MKKSLSPISDARTDNLDLTRRLYRCITETVRQLDDCRSHAKSCADLFTVHAEVLRVKLRECAERLIFTNPVGHGRKAEEILWRKGFYDDVSIAKRLRKSHGWLPEEEAHLRLHLSAGFGFYHHLLLRLQAEFRLDLDRSVDFSMLLPDKECYKNMVAPPAKQVEWARESAHRCLVYLGDLSRYLVDLAPSWDSGLPVRYYRQALSLNPDVGMPHNQLGTLSANINCSLDAAYHYMRCMMCTQPFEGAEGNLRRIMERNSQWLEIEAVGGHNVTLWRRGCVEPSDPRPRLSEAQENIQRFIARFLLLVDVWFFDKTSVPNINQLCHQTLLDLHHCLDYSDPDSMDAVSDPKDVNDFALPSTQRRTEHPSHLSQDILFKIVVMALMCLSKLQVKGSEQASAVVAFALALFSLLVQRVIQHFNDSVLNVSVPSNSGDDKKSNESSTLATNGNKNGLISSMKDDALQLNSNGNSNIENDALANRDGKICDKGEVTVSGSTETNGVTKDETKKGKKSHRLRKIGRRRRRNIGGLSEDSELSETEALYSSGSSVSDVSEDEEVVLDLSSDDDDDETKLELSSDDGNDVVVLEEAEETVHGDGSLLTNGHATGNSKQSNGILKNIHKETSDPADVLELVAGEGLLPAIKVCTDWLQGDVGVVRACGRDSRDVLQSIVDLANIINIDIKELEKSLDSNYFLLHRKIFEKVEKVPLPEDVLLQKLSIFGKSHKDLDWDSLRRYRLNVKEEALVRAYKVVQFCSFLEGVAGTGVTYDALKRCFSLNDVAKTNGTVPHSTNVPPSGPSTDPKKRGELMHNMGQLWLRAEVQALESRVKSGNGASSFSPYLVLDAEALINHCIVVRQLVAARKFIMLVPNVVLSALDQLKRESSLARDAIRWLEFQFQKGSRFLRAQRNTEALQLPLITYPKRKDREAWTLFQVFECCYYLNQQTSASRDTAPDTALVTLLTGRNWKETSEFSPIGTAKSVGVNIEHIEIFFAKWKTSSKSHG